MRRRDFLLGLTASLAASPALADAPRPFEMKWPGPKGGDQVLFAVGERGGGTPSRSFSGQWAWLRFLDAAMVTPQPDGFHYKVSVSAGGHEATLTLAAPSLRMGNPYRSSDLQQFRCQ